MRILRPVLRGVSWIVETIIDTNVIIFDLFTDSWFHRLYGRVKDYNGMAVLTHHLLRIDH